MSICEESTKLALEQSTWLSLQEYGQAFGIPGPLPPLLLIAFPGFWFFCSTDIHPRKDNIETTMSTKACVGGKESEKINVCPEELHFPALCCCHDSSRGERGEKKKRDTDEDQSRTWWNYVVQADNELVFLGEFFFFSICHIHFSASITPWDCPHLTVPLLHQAWLWAHSIFGTIHQHVALNRNSLRCERRELISVNA